MELVSIKQKKKKRLGRGNASGLGTYSGRGQKGQRARSGGKPRPGFEGGRTPLIRQLPKMRGFKTGRPKAEVINVKDLARVFKDGETVGPRDYARERLIRSYKKSVKVLSQGEIKMKLTVRANFFSQAAKKKIEKAGGKVEVVGRSE